MHHVDAHDLEHGEGLVLVTGATGLLGAAVVQRWAACRAAPRLAVLVRDASRWQRTAARMQLPPGSVTVLTGDLTQDALGLDAATRARLRREASAVVHLAADTVFSRTLDEARAVNRDGTRRLLELAADCPRVERVAFVSTAFVAGRRTGVVPEAADGAADAATGWVNAYEQSKAEAETLLRATRRDALVLRSSTVACDDMAGGVTQWNAVHRALRLVHDGLAAMMPAVATSTLDVVPTDYVAGAIARLALRAGIDGDTVHLCAGAGAMPFDELLDDTFVRWSRSPAWRRRAIARPALGDLATWELFVRSVEETGHARLRQVMHALSHFAPQLALAKRFETSRAERLLGHGAPPVHTYWGRMVDHLTATGWRDATALTSEAA